MTRSKLLRLFAIVGMAVGLLAQIPQAQAATAQFELHYRCSPWMYLSVVTDDIRDTWHRTRGAELKMDIDATNAQLCRQNAERLTFAANTTFAMNGIPVNFTYTTEVLPGGGGRVLGRKFRSVTFTHDLHDYVEGIVNGGGVVPDIYVDDLDYEADVDTSTCNPWDAGTAGCFSLIGTVCPPSNSYEAPCKNAAGGTVFLRASPFPSSYHHLTLFDTDTWSAATAPKGARRINVTLRATMGPGNQVLGIANGTYDRASTVLELNDGTLTRRALTPANYLPTLAVITLVANPTSVFNVAAIPHEIGHVFGAQHQRSSMVGDEFYVMAGLATGYQFANLKSEAGYGSYDTLMARHATPDSTLSFSTPIPFTTEFYSSPPCGILGDPGTVLICPINRPCICRSRIQMNIGSSNTDNRRYVAETIKWITGDASFVLSAPADPANTSIFRVMR